MEVLKYKLNAPCPASITIQRVSFPEKTETLCCPDSISAKSAIIRNKHATTAFLRAMKIIYISLSTIVQ